MKMRKAIKSIMALGTGAAMMGATMFGAMAADLSDYPSPLFIKDGVFDGLLVVGDNAAAEDIIGITNIAISLQSAAVVTKTVETATTTVTVSGDSAKVAESTNLLEMGEFLNSIRTSMTSSDLVALADGTINNEHGDFDYTQTIDVAENASVVWDTDPDDDSDTYHDFLKYFTDNQIYRYKISFTPALKSDHKVVTGTDYLEDIRDKDITLLGRKYTILRADHVSDDRVALTFMGGAVTDILAEHATKTYTLKGKEYEVTVSYIGASEVLFTVGGEATDKLAETETYRLSDGVEVGVNNILAQNVAGEAGGDQVEFTLGAQKIKFEDTNTSLKTPGSCTTTIGVDTSTNVECDIVGGSDAGTASGADITISTLEVYYNNSDDLYIAAGGSTADIADAEEDEDGVFFLDAFDIKYEGLTMDSPTVFEIVSSGNTKYKLKFTNKAGSSYNEFVWYTPTASAVGVNALLGKSADRDLVIDETEQISKNEYFVVSKNKYSRILQYTDIDTTNSIVKVKDLGTGSTIEVSYQSSLFGDLILDGNTYGINVSAASSSATIYVDMNGDGAKDDVRGGGRIYNINEGYLDLMSTSPANESVFNITSGEDEDNNRDTVQVVIETNGDGDIDIGAVTGTSGSIGSFQQGDAYLYEDYTYAEALTSTASASTAAFGMKVSWDKKSSGNTQDSLKVSMGKTATIANVFFTSGAVETATAAGGGVTTEEVQEIDVGAVKLASEVSSPNADNLILVGGPCANSVARTVMGVTSANCAEGFEAGKAMIKLYEHAAGKVAMVVAGAGAVDTRRAALVVANYKDYVADLVGDEVVVTTVTSTPTVAQPVAAEAEGE